MPIYRAFPVDQAGHIFDEPHEFEAKTDIDAIAQAMQFAESYAVEVWDAGRRVGLIKMRPIEERCGLRGLHRICDYGLTAIVATPKV
ncbi:hypothetical protein SAMN05444170_3579 [Bradyrhizobium erythrophlei]|uniref:Uncharacterized protein n=1 Tax=Bradyrhizobium erythrophlei TaxID=1437360 RepID=A0A1M7U5B4_9BRAD|nr:hypothetical protein SAMN05444170_3579 [Bradyrhizobium erythrophlei]